jgi:hypothetical protein
VTAITLRSFRREFLELQTRFARPTHAGIGVMPTATETMHRGEGVMANVHWSYWLGGSWQDGGFWSSGSVPTVADNVYIGIPGVLVTSDADAAVNSIGLTEDSFLTIGDNSWFTTVNGTGARANHGQIKVVDNSTLQIDQGTFDNAGTIWLGASGNYNELVINTQVTLDGGGTIYLSAHPNGGTSAIIGQLDYPNPNMVLYNVDNTITGTGQITGLNFDNEANGTVETGGGTLELLTNNVTGQGFENSGHINADNGGTLELVSWAGALPFYNYGSIGVNSTGNSTTLEIGGDVKLKGGGSVTLSDSAYNHVVTNGAAATLDNVDNTISGSGWFEDSLLKLVNGTHGLIIADNADAALGFNVGSLTNAGFIIAGPGATLAINGAVDNSGKVVIGGNVEGSGQELIFSNGNMMLNGSANHLAVTFENDSVDTGVLIVGLQGASSAGFTGTLAGLYSDGTHSDILGLRSIDFASGVAWSFTENAGGTGGELTVSDGSGHVADVALIGQYLAANGSATSAASDLFMLSADYVTGSTGTLVTTSFHG